MLTCCRMSDNNYQEIVTRYLKTVRFNPYIPHEPTEKQALFLMHDHIKEILYGGAAGGGKSDALLMGALQYVHVPEYRALLFRRTYKDLALPKALMDRADEWLSGTDAKWDASERTWKFPSGASLTFGYLENDRDKYRYQSAEFQYIAFDELTQFTETQYLYLFSRLRRLAGQDIPLRMRAASNPGGIGHQWVYRRFVNPDTRKNNLFIPARLEDNPYLDKEQYEDSLSELDRTTWRQLREGDWLAKREGALFSTELIDAQRVTRTPALIRVVVGVDPAVTSGESSDETGIVAAGLDAAGHCYILGDYSLRGTPLDWARAVVKGFRRHQADRVIGEVNNGGDLVEMNLRQVDPNIPFTKVHASRGKIIRAEPIAALYEQGRVHHLGTFPELEDQMTNWVPGDKSPDHFDALVWALHELTSGEEVQEIIVYDSDYQISPI